MRFESGGSVEGFGAPFISAFEGLQLGWELLACGRKGSSWRVCHLVVLGEIILILMIAVIVVLFLEL